MEWGENDLKKTGDLQQTTNFGLLISNTQFLYEIYRGKRIITKQKTMNFIYPFSK